MGDQDRESELVWAQVEFFILLDAYYDSSGLPSPCRRVAVEAMPQDYPDRARLLGRRFERTGSLSDLNRVIETASVALRDIESHSAFSRIRILALQALGGRKSGGTYVS
jgi:hypothetical protein